MPTGVQARPRLNNHVNGMTMTSSLQSHRHIASLRRQPDPQRIAIILLVPLLPLSSVGASTLSVGAVIGLILAPIALPAATKYRGTKLLLSLWATCLAFGPILASITAGELSRSLNQRLEIRILLLIFTTGVTLYVLLWSRSVIGTPTTAALYAIGLIAEAVVSQATATAANPWKYAFAFPVAMLLLAVARSRLQSVLSLTALAGISIIEHSRSFAALSILAAIAVLVTPWGRDPNRSIHTRTVAVMSASVIALYFLASTALLSGWLGESLRKQAVVQTRNGEVTLIVGARPEWAAGFELFQARPFGFGPGVVPNTADVSAGLAGLVGLGIDRDHPYVQEYLFDNRLELHSIIGDLWLLFGIPGLLLSGVITWRLLGGLVTGAARGTIGALGILASCVALWDMAFSPVTNLRYGVLALAILLPLSPCSRPKATVPRLADEPEAYR